MKNRWRTPLLLLSKSSSGFRRPPHLEVLKVSWRKSTSWSILIGVEFQKCFQVWHFIKEWEVFHNLLDLWKKPSIKKATKIIVELFWLLYKVSLTSFKAISSTRVKWGPFHLCRKKSIAHRPSKSLDAITHLFGGVHGRGAYTRTWLLLVDSGGYIRYYIHSGRKLTMQKITCWAQTKMLWSQRFTFFCGFNPNMDHYTWSF